MESGSSNSIESNANNTKRSELDGGLNPCPPPSKRLRESRDITSFFDSEKCPSSLFFRKDEIWAVRDEYGMPRRYVLIEKDGDIHHIAVIYLRNYYARYGDYRVLRAWGKFIRDDWPQLDPSCFSHKLGRITKEFGMYPIFPRKGQVWAIRAENSTTPFGNSTPTLLKYQMVEVTEDYVDFRGTRIVHLVRVEGGCRTQFRRYQGEFQARPKYVTERFSHQVPCFRGDNGCLELDPSSLPLYVYDFVDKGEPKITDNYLFLGLLDHKVYKTSGDSSVWAAYDKQCQIPCKYVKLDRQLDSSDAHRRAWRFEMHELVPNLDNEKEKRWQESGLPVACGCFKKKPEETKEDFILSHKVYFSRDSGNQRDLEKYSTFICNGHVWGFYKDKNKYAIVVVIGRNWMDSKLSKKGVEVAFLVRVEGFKGLFRKKSGNASDVQFVVPEDEFYRLSHRIPSYGFDEKCTKEFLRGTFVLDPSLVPKREGECFCFDDEFLLDRSKARPSWSAIFYIADKLKNSRSLDSEKNDDMIIVDLQGFCEKSVEAPTNLDIVHLHRNIKFHDFEAPELSENFKLGQVWALHDGTDGLPQSYARINKLLGSGEEVEVVLLEPHPISDEEMQWVEMNLPMACGIFRASKFTSIKELTLFSHRVICDDRKSSEMFYRVFPRRGEVWAIYRHWNRNSSYSDMMNNVKYKLVQVVSDFKEKVGVRVAALVRVEGQEDVVRRDLHEDFGLFLTIKRNDLLRFSYRIPSLKLKGSGGAIKIKFSHGGI